MTVVAGNIDKVITVSALVGTLIIGCAWIDAFKDMSEMEVVITKLESERDAAVDIAGYQEVVLQVALNELRRTRSNVRKATQEQGCPAPQSKNR